MAGAAADGYTLIMGQMGTHAAAPSLYESLKYNPVTDFTPVGIAGITPILIVARKDFPANNLAELIAYVKANPDKSTCQCGVGSFLYDLRTGSSVCQSRKSMKWLTRAQALR